MLEKHDKADEEIDKKLEEVKEGIKKANHMKRMLAINEPKWLVFFGIFFAICNGAVLPFVGVF